MSELNNKTEVYIFALKGLKEQFQEVLGVHVFSVQMVQLKVCCGCCDVTIHVRMSSAL